MMFIVLQPLPEEKNFLLKVKNRLFPPAPRLEEVRLGGCSAFYQIYAQYKGEKLPWKKIESLAEQNTHRFLFPDGLAVPEGFSTPVMSKFREEALWNAFLCFCKKALERNPEWKITFVDANARWKDRMEPLFSVAAQVRVVTNRPELYEDISYQILEATGAPLLLCWDIQAARDSHAVIAPFGIDQTAQLPDHTLLFLEGKSKTRARNTILGRRISLPEEYGEALPNGISPLLFASALFEFCGAKKLASVGYDTFSFQEREIGLYDLIKLVFP